MPIDYLRIVITPPPLTLRVTLQPADFVLLMLLISKSSFKEPDDKIATLTPCAYHLSMQGFQED